ncbi:hypothetical protein LEMLEM_LOCUS10356 [Lemmus lemmus]
MTLAYSHMTWTSAFQLSHFKMSLNAKRENPCFYIC